jgi:geranylgeranyl reductase family protein
MSECYDLVIIGAGPAGCSAALEAASLGLGSVLLLEKENLPREKPCGGGIGPQSRRFLKRRGLWREVARAGYPIHAARLHTPSGQDFVLRGGSRAAVVRRSRLDAILARAAAAAGAVLRPGCPAEGLILERGRAVGVRAGGAELRAGWVLVANGSLTRFHRHSSPRHRWLACLGRYEGVPFRPHTIELLFSQKLFPRYGWLFPESADQVNIGLCLEHEWLRGRRIQDLFAEFLLRHFATRLSGARPMGELQVHTILPSDRIELRNVPGTLAAGDAARLVNLFTGEGISYALRSGRLAARALAAGLERGWSDERVAACYRAGLRRHLEPSLRIGGWVCGSGRAFLHLGSRLAGLSLGRRFIYRTLAR